MPKRASITFSTGTGLARWSAKSVQNLGPVLFTCGDPAAERLSLWPAATHLIRSPLKCLRWRDAPAAYGSHTTIYNRFVRWSRLGVFNCIFAEFAAKGEKPDRSMIDASHLKAHRTVASLLKKGSSQPSGAPKVG